MVNFWGPQKRNEQGLFLSKRMPDRIDLILAVFKYKWLQQDQLRFGQFVYNLCRDEEGKFDEKKLIFLEDEALLERLLKWQN